MYRVVSYFFGKLLAELPMNLIVPILFMSIDYFLIGFNNHAKNIIMAYVIAIIGYNAASAFALLLSSFISDKSVAVSLTPVIIVPFFLLAGFFVNQSNIPVWLYEFEYLSIFRYMFQAFCIVRNYHRRMSMTTSNPSTASHLSVSIQSTICSSSLKL